MYKLAFQAAALLLCALLAHGSGEDAVTVIPPAGEPGEPLLVEGRVMAEDGETPLKGVKVHVYHTDAQGYYSPGGRNEREHRLNGTMFTDAEGWYRFRTIRPAGYPDTRIPAHIHYVISGEKVPRQTFQLNFKDDPRLSPRQVEHRTGDGAFSRVRPLERGEDGVWRCRKDFKVRTRGNR